MWNKPCSQVKRFLDPNDRREMQLLAALGAALVWTKGPGPEADAAFDDALKIAESLDDADYQIRILWGCGPAISIAAEFGCLLIPQKNSAT